MKINSKIELEKEIKKLLEISEHASKQTNLEKRIAHSRIELFKLDLSLS